MPINAQLTEIKAATPKINLTSEHRGKNKTEIMKIDFRQIKISVYRGVHDTSGHISTLYDFLNNVEYDAINELRATVDPTKRKQIKLSLPQATISGIFSPKRSAENLAQHSGLICVDIDRKDNLHIGNFDSLIEDTLSKIEEVAFAAHSVGGNGYFLIIPLKYPDMHVAQFKMLVRKFDDIGINIDRACGDVCRLRCQSYDLHQYVNLNAVPFSGIYREPPPIRRGFDYHFSEIDAGDKVAALCRDIEMYHIDLTANYEDWMKIGAALSTLGESGRQWFHLCSSQNPKYNAAECNRKFTNLLRSTRRIGLGTFFHLCKNAGLKV